jgi:predicted nucleotidyltransferase component of viral defense system
MSSSGAKAKVRKSHLGIRRVRITEWGQIIPWKNRIYLEQDLIISRLLIEIFNHPEISQKLAFRGGTALHKLFLSPPARYSEDIDLVQIVAEPIGDILGNIKKIITPILGKCKWKLNEGRATLIYRFIPEDALATSAKIKIEINTREPFSVFGFQQKDFAINSRWFTGSTKIQTYELNELIATKLRALYQRKKSRDLFDIWLSLQQNKLDTKKTIMAFQKYMQNQNITRAMFEENLTYKMQSPIFTTDISPILSTNTGWNIASAMEQIKKELLSLLPGNSWKGNES